MSENPPLSIERIFDAPVELVYQAWTDPELMKQWWGPKSFTCPTAQLDVKVGGRYLLAMKNPGWGIIWSGGRYEVVVPNEKIVLTDHFADKDGNQVNPTVFGMDKLFPKELRIEIDFEDLEGKTKMTLNHYGLGKSKVKQQTNTGWNESFDKLVKALSKTKIGG